MMYSFLHVVFLILMCVDVLGILGGREIPIENAPYQINYGDICGGVLVNDKWAITSAHCGKVNFIRLGSKYHFRGYKVTIVSHLIHPKFKLSHDFDYDIQLLKLHKSVQFSAKTRPIRIKIRNSGSQYGDHIYVSGWGHSLEKGEYSDVLQQVKLKIVPLEDCQRVQKYIYNNTLTSRMFCAEGNHKDACQGDSGGGAVNLGQLVGISSFGYGCGRNYPGVYTNVSHPEIRMWILGFIGN